MIGLYGELTHRFKVEWVQVIQGPRFWCSSKYKKNFTIVKRCDVVASRRRCCSPASNILFQVHANIYIRFLWLDNVKNPTLNNIWLEYVVISGGNFRPTTQFCRDEVRPNSNSFMALEPDLRSVSSTTIRFPLSGHQPFISSKSKLNF